MFGASDGLGIALRAGPVAMADQDTVQLAQNAGGCRAAGRFQASGYRSDLMMIVEL
jgi:hypothetical protein